MWTGEEKGWKPETVTSYIVYLYQVTGNLNAFSQHAEGKDVVAYLANFGIEVNEGLVSTVKMESLKKPGEGQGGG